MADDVNTPIDDALQKALSRLADALFDFSGWIAAKAYVPPADQAPWRSPGQVLTPSSLNVMPFLVALLRETSGDLDLSARWSDIGQEPLKFCPLQNPAGWRARRGLWPVPKFDVAASLNAPFSRLAFYTSCWTPLKAVLAASNPQSDADWKALVDKLFADGHAGWPVSPPPSSSTFMTQFGCDLLYAMMGMRNQFADPQLRDALLVELGETRRVGNTFTVDDVADAVEVFRKKVRDSTVATGPK